MADRLSQYDSIFEDAGKAWNVDPLLLKSIAKQESGGNPGATSSANAQGVMQIIPSTQRYLGVTDPRDPVQSIFGGAKYMAEALAKEGTPEAALLYYHGGPGWRGSYGPESQGYVPAVTSHYRQFSATRPPPAPGDAAPVQVAEAKTGATMTDVGGSAVETPADFLKRTERTAPAPTAEGQPPKVETPAEFLKRTTGTAAPVSPGAEAPPGPYSEFGDLSAQPWAQGPPVPDGAVAPAARIGQAAIEGYRNAPSLPPSWTEAIDAGGPVGRQITNPLLRLGGAVVGGMAGVGAGIGQTAWEVGNALAGPRLGRDFSMGNEVVQALLPQVSGPRAGLRPDLNPLKQPPTSVMERMAPPPIEGQSTGGRIGALIRHDDQWNNPDAPGYAPPGANPLNDTRFLPPADAPPAPPPGFIPPNKAGPRVGGTPPGATPHGLTPEQLAEHDKIPEGLPPLRKEIVTQADAEARADEIIRHFAGVGNKEPLPGVEGSLPAVTQNSGIATLYRAVRDKDTPVQFELAEKAVKKAVKEKLDKMSGTEDDLNAAVRLRATTVDPLYKKAWANKTEADPSGAIKTVEDLMNSPLKQNDTAMAELKNIHKKLQGETDPEQLKGITDSIDATVQRLNTEGKGDRHTRAALAAVDEAITKEIGRAAPGFDEAQATYANHSRRIDEMKYFQSRKLSDLQGDPTLNNLRTTLDDISKKQAGDKFHPADSVTKENHETLRQLHDQLQREAFTASAGKSLGGSNTFQNAATNSVMRQVAKQAGANLLGTGGGYLTDLLAGGGGTTGAVIGNIGGNVLQGVRTVREAQAAARQTAGEAMLMRALRERLLNINGKGVESLRGPPPSP